MNINRYSLYDNGFKKFLDFWNSEVEKKLFRCSKEYGIFNLVKKTLNPKSKSNWDDNLYAFYRNLQDELILNRDSIIDFSNGNENLIKRKYCVRTAQNDNRHLAQLVIFHILQRSMIDSTKFKQVFLAMDKELYKGRRMRNFCYEKWGFVKLFFS
jgi:hypothetical protein